MEEEVNVHHEELMNSKSCDTVLSNQMQRLLMCFDIYLETEAAGSEEEGPMEISKEKIYNRMLRCVFYMYMAHSTVFKRLKFINLL